MPGYLNATELSSMLPLGATIGTNTTPLTLAEVGSVIFEVSAELDAAAAAAGYAVPILSPASSGPTYAYAQMQRWAREGAGAFVLFTLYGGENALAKDYRAAYQATLKLLRKGELPLIGAGADAGGEGRELPRSYSTSNPTATVGVEPHLDMDAVF